MCTHKHTEGEEGKWRNGTSLKINIWWDFPGSPAVETPGFWCRGHRFDPWLGNWDLICPVAQPKIKTKTNKQKFAEHLATWCKELTHWKRPWCWERSKAGREGDDRGWDGWMTSLTQWTWVWVSSGSWWWTGRPGMLQSMGLQRAKQLNWTEHWLWPGPVLTVSFHPPAHAVRPASLSLCRNRGTERLSDLPSLSVETKKIYFRGPSM